VNGKLRDAVGQGARDYGAAVSALRRSLPTGCVGRLPIAGAPERHEPDRGELNHACGLALFEDLGNAGFVDCEFHFHSRDACARSAGLGRFQPCGDDR
jgi:hydroxypyruvate isomerase